MWRRWRNLGWLLLILCVVGPGAQYWGVSHELDGQVYSAELRGFAYTRLELTDGSFTLRRHTCTGNGQWHGNYRLEGNVLHLCLFLQPGFRFVVRKSAGRTYLDSAGRDFDRTLKLIADATGGPRPPHWSGGPLRVNGIYPGMARSALDPKLRLIVRDKERVIYGSDQHDLAVSVKGNRVLAVVGPKLVEGQEQTLLESGEKNEWIEQCLGQRSCPDHMRALDRFGCGLAVGWGEGYLGPYCLGEISEVVALRDALLSAGVPTW